MSLPPAWGQEAARGFAPRRVGLGELPGLLKECGALLGAAPGRLLGYYLLIFIPVVLTDLLGPPGIVQPLGSALGGVWFAGYFTVLARVRAGQAPELRDLLRVWSLPADKLRLLVILGLVPVAAAWTAWCVDVGPQATMDVLAGKTGMKSLGFRAQFEYLGLTELGAMPLVFFVQPLCVLRPWSGSRTLSGSLLAWFANWRMAILVVGVAVLVDVGVAVLVDAGLERNDAQNAFDLMASLAIDLAEGIAENAFTLVLLLRSLGPEPGDPGGA